ncbi:MAG: YicC family protein [Bacteroidales bacterium]|nr:YicC family protein [Bacteroidales bacterium]
MTGYGRSECTIGNCKYICEIRSLNGKNADIGLKTSIVPMDKEIELRKYIVAEAGRGSIDLFISTEVAEDAQSRTINANVFKGYISQLESIAEGVSSCDPSIVASVLRLPDVIDSKKAAMTDDEWKILESAIKDAVSNLLSFREREGKILAEDLLSKVDKIESYIPFVEQFESERIDTVRARILKRVEEMNLAPDENRLEQEIIFYLEKLDVNEEKVRLRQHCRYFRETMEKEEMPGKKLGFIAQEMGREINTLGSKANHAEMQKFVVKMKDELEKIKEQVLNVL